MKKEDPAITAARLEEIELALSWVGNVKKQFQREQTRLRKAGADVRFKPVWQSLNDTIWLFKKRQEKLITTKGKENE